MQHQHVERRTIVVVDSPTSVDLNDLDPHGRAVRGSAANGVGRKDLHDPIPRANRGSMIELAGPIAIAMVFSIRWRASFECRGDHRLAHCETARLEGRRMFLAR